MAKPKRYEVYDLVKGNLLVEGTAMRCADALGLTADSIRSMANGKYSSRKYDVREIKPPGAEEKAETTGIDHGLVSAAKQWDAFCEPIRKKYGIPVYRPGKENNK